MLCSKISQIISNAVMEKVVSAKHHLMGSQHHTRKLHLAEQADKDDCLCSVDCSRACTNCVKKNASCNEEHDINITVSSVRGFVRPAATQTSTGDPFSPQPLLPIATIDGLQVFEVGRPSYLQPNLKLPPQIQVWNLAGLLQDVNFTETLG
ncbi:hypothetical protein ILYODFUR_021176 [Ilyodon furcidens]|uniref:Uncharacterized protein n=1 Tax=Ilyodon furcidens TaxID=33524 RepID=A0ABV0VIG7_9TELE